ncbi:hypothetical protein [Bradyrhizobium sp. USDA 4506]
MGGNRKERNPEAESFGFPLGGDDLFVSRIAVMALARANPPGASEVRKLENAQIASLRRSINVFRARRSDYSSGYG